MRHNKKFNHLGRQSAHRKAMLANMASSLIAHKRIRTTVAKAKALKIYVEPLVTKSKEDTTHSRRVVFSYLQDKNAVTELFRIVAPKVGDRPGGYTRILKTGFRLGDAADMCIIELVDFNDTYSAEGTAATKSRTRRSRGGTKKAAVAETAAPETAVVETGIAEDVIAETLETEPVDKPAAAPKSAAKPAVAKKPAAAKQKPVARQSTPRVSGAKKGVAVKTGISKKS